MSFCIIIPLEIISEKIFSKENFYFKKIVFNECDLFFFALFIFKFGIKLEVINKKSFLKINFYLKKNNI